LKGLGGNIGIALLLCVSLRLCVIHYVDSKKLSFSH